MSWKENLSFEKNACPKKSEACGMWMSVNDCLNDSVADWYNEHRSDETRIEQFNMKATGKDSR